MTLTFPTHLTIYSVLTKYIQQTFSSSLFKRNLKQIQLNPIQWPTLLSVICLFLPVSFLPILNVARYQHYQSLKPLVQGPHRHLVFKFPYQIINYDYFYLDMIINYLLILPNNQLSHLCMKDLTAKCRQSGRSVGR